MWDTLLFVCAICDRDVRDLPERRGPDQQIAPVCRFCEGHYAGHPKVGFGAFRDRRKLRQLKALAVALSGEANCRQWEQDNGYAARL